MSQDSFDTDPRTLGVQGSRSNRRLLAKHYGALRAHLRPTEQVLWALGHSGLRPQVGALTDSRLLFFFIAEPDKAPQILRAPYTVIPGAKKILGHSVTLRDAGGAQVQLTLGPLDHQELTRVAGAPAEAGQPNTRGQAPFVSTAPLPPSSPPPLTALGQATVAGGWRWQRPVTSWQDAEVLAANHMRHLRFEGVLLTPAGRDQGLDVVAKAGAAQVKFRVDPSGAPEIQQLRGAADGFPARLFYATAFTPAAVTAADAAGLALFQFTSQGDVVAVNQSARALVASQAPPSPAPKRGALGMLTREGRQERAIGWAQQIQDATQKPISNRKRKGARQLVEREQALQLLVAGLAQLEDSGNPLYKRLRQDRTMSEAEKTLKKAAALLGVRLR